MAVAAARPLSVKVARAVSVARLMLAMPQPQGITERAAVVVLVTPLAALEPAVASLLASSPRPRRSEAKLMISQALLALCLAQPVPPAPYDHGGRFHPRAIIIERHSSAWLSAKMGPGWEVYGVTYFRLAPGDCSGGCYVYIANDLSPTCRAKALRHEAAHTWGWPRNHPR